jgi:hypothetical protein
LKEAEEITLEAWNARPKYKQLLEKSARLVSPICACASLVMSQLVMTFLDYINKKLLLLLS